MRAAPAFLLINPTSRRATTAMMVAMARIAARGGDGRMQARILGVTARHAPAVIVTVEALAAAEAEMLSMARLCPPGIAGIIVGAFGDPGLAAIRARLALPVTGLGEAAMLQAAGVGRFGVATVTPGLVGAIAARAQALGLDAHFTGTRITPGDLPTLMADPARLVAALTDAVARCVVLDGAEAVIIDGGPSSQAAARLQRRSPVPLIVPVQAAVGLLLAARGLVGGRDIAHL